MRLQKKQILWCFFLFFLVFHDTLVVNNVLLTNDDENMHWVFMDMIEDHPVHEKFKLWHYVMKKPYKLQSNHGSERFEIFKKNHDLIISHNSKNNEKKFELGLGPFADMTFEEFKKDVNLVKPKGSSQKINNGFLSSSSKKENKYPFFQADDSYYNTIFDFFDRKADEIDKKEIKINSNTNLKTGYDYLESEYRDFSTIFSYVGNQYFCGACWAFATTSIVEAAFYLKNEKSSESFLALSPQQLVDCDEQDNGCSGGWYENSLQYLKNNPLSSLKDYPYYGVVQKCDTKLNSKKVQIKDYYSCDPDHQNCFAQASDILKISPYATAIAVTEELMHYKSGILEYSCTDKEIDHAIVVVHITNDYLKIRNSWGDLWGEKGYFRFQRSKENNLTCFMEKYFFYVEDVEIVEQKR